MMLSLGRDKIKCEKWAGFEVSSVLWRVHCIWRSQDHRNACVLL